MRVRVWSIILGLLLSGCATSGSAQSSAPAVNDLASLVPQFLDTDDRAEAERVLQRILSDPQASVDTVSRIIQVDRRDQSQSREISPNQQLMVRGRTYSLALAIPTTYEASKEYALVVCLHGFGFTGEEYVERWRGRLSDDYLLACPTYPAGAWFTRQAEELVLETIRQVRHDYSIDPNRIFLTGMSNGGIGAWLIGMHHAPMFAGIAPMASGLDSVLMPFLANLRNTPVYIIHGAKDQVMPVDLSRSISRELKVLGYAYEYREHEREHPMAGGHYFPKEELPDLVTWFKTQRREPIPTRLTVVRDASHFHSFNWVRLDTTDAIAAFSEDLVDKRDDRIKHREYAKLDASITNTNRIEVTTEQVQRYSLFLNDRLVDLSKPLTVITNGVVSFEGTVSPSVETLLRQARYRQDPQQLFPVHLSIVVQPQSP